MYVENTAVICPTQISELICLVPLSSCYLRNSTYTAITIHDNATDMWSLVPITDAENKNKNFLSNEAVVCFVPFPGATSRIVHIMPPLYTITLLICVVWCRSQKLKMKVKNILSYV